MNAVPEEVQTYADMLGIIAEMVLPDEKPYIRKPLLDGNTDVLSVKLVVRGGRNVIDWSVPLVEFGDDEKLTASLENAIAKAGLAGIVRVVRANAVPAVVEAGSNVISPNPAVPPTGASTLASQPPFSQEAGDDPDAFVPQPPAPVMQAVPQSPKPGANASTNPPARRRR